MFLIIDNIYLKCNVMHLQRECNKCNTRDSFYVYDTLEKRDPI